MIEKRKYCDNPHIIQVRDRMVARDAIVSEFDQHGHYYHSDAHRPILSMGQKVTAPLSLEDQVCTMPFPVHTTVADILPECDIGATVCHAFPCTRCRPLSARCSEPWVTTSFTHDVRLRSGWRRSGTESSVCGPQWRWLLTRS